jgi:hypothetical protein
LVFVNNVDIVLLVPNRILESISDIKKGLPLDIDIFDKLVAIGLFKLVRRINVTQCYIIGFEDYEGRFFHTTEGGSDEIALHLNEAVFSNQFLSVFEFNDKNFIFWNASDNK